MADLSIQKHPDGGYLLRGECVIPRPLDEVFAFFADAANLEVLTPPWLNFRILTPRPIAMRPGCLIDYRLRVRGVPIRWQSEITAWEAPHRFVDEARRGPYKFWRHEHRFEPCDDGTRVFDAVHYGVPGGALVHWLVVGRDVRTIFAYRQQVLAKLFPAEKRQPATAPQ
jgi:ligand-binding SRPBCC domain-containing protein